MTNDFPIKELNLIRTLKKIELLIEMALFENVSIEIKIALSYQIEYVSKSYKMTLDSIADDIKQNNFGKSKEGIETLINNVSKDLMKYNCYSYLQGLTSTSDSKVRFCKKCNRNVYEADSLAEAQDRAVIGQCIILRESKYPASYCKEAFLFDKISCVIKHNDVEDINPINNAKR